MDNTHLRYERTHSAIGQAVTEKLHGGYAATGRADGGLLRKINEAKDKLNGVSLEHRDEYWCAAAGGVRYAEDPLAQGRRAKAGKVLANAKELIEYAA
jgi:hypothetical protein